MSKYVKQGAIRSLGELDLGALLAANRTNVPEYSIVNVKLEILTEAVAALLCGWPLEDVEEAAWVFALDGWQKTPPLVAEYDVAFHQHYVPCVDIVKGRNGDPRSLEFVGIFLGELRNRVQFLQTRAADIRLSAQIDRLTDSAFARVEPALDELLRIVQTTDPRGALRNFEDSGKADLLIALANYVGRLSPETGAALAVMRNERVFSKLSAVVSALTYGVAGNVLTDKLKELFDFMSKYHP